MKKRKEEEEKERKGKWKEKRSKKETLNPDTSNQNWELGSFCKFQQALQVILAH